MKISRVPKVALSVALGAVVSLSLAVFAADLSPVSDFGPSEPGFNGATQVARVTQAGAGNRLAGVQSGHNGLMANQAGVANAAVMAQAGTDNWMTLSQSGSGNQYGGYQVGTNNRSVTVQSGSSNAAAVTWDEQRCSRASARMLATVSRRSASPGPNAHFCSAFMGSSSMTRTLPVQAQLSQRTS